MDTLTIGDLGKAAGVAPKTIRFYETKGLLPRPARSSGHYRIYGAADLQRVTLIRRARALGFTLAEVKHLLTAAEHAPCASFEGELARETTRKLAEVDALMARLAQTKQQLSSLAERLAHQACSDCQSPALACFGQWTGDGACNTATGREVEPDEARRLPVSRLLPMSR